MTQAAAASVKDPLNQALLHHSAGQLDDAASSYGDVLAIDPDHVEANNLLGLICFQRGKIKLARDLFARATKDPTATAEMHNNLGVALNALGQMDEASTAFTRALGVKADYPEALNNLGSIHRARGQTALAVSAFRRAIALRPKYAEAKANLRATYRDVIPVWHFAMMNDSLRNDAYDAAIKRAVAGKHVLDIGTGAGLLAMMAARAQAASVTSCEMVEPIAKQAEVIIAQQELNDRISIVGKSSTDLEVGGDLPVRANVLVTETFSSGLLNEGVLASIEHAHAHLLAPNATVIPAAATACGYLVGGAMLRDKLFVKHVCGFDLEAFNDFAAPKIGLYLDREPHDVLSDDFELIRFDLSQKAFPIGHHDIEVTATRHGSCVGVAQWLRLELDDEISYANRPSPDAGSNGWTHIVYRFPKLLTLRPGDTVRLLVRHDREQLSVDLVE